MGSGYQISRGVNRRKQISYGWLTILITIGTSLSSFSQQLPLFSQYVFNTLHINPGYAGYKLDPFLQATFRSQYIDFPGAPRTFSISADMPINEDQMGVGFSAFSDQIGANRTTSALATYAYRIQTGDNAFLGMGISGGVLEYMLDGSLLRPEDIDDATIPTGRLNLLTPSLNTGLFFHTNRFFSGLSIYNLIGKRNLTREDLSLTMHNIHYYFNVGGLINLTDEVEFKPSVLVRKDQNGPTNYDLNGMFLFYERIWLGASYRSHIKKNNAPQPNLTRRNAIALIVDLFATKDLRIGYAYDYNMNVLNNYRNNSHEISIGYYIGDRGLNNHGLKCF